MSLAVLKFGGSSVADATRIKRVAERIAGYRENNIDTVVVVSAMGDSTDDLISLAKQVSSQPGDREMDMLLSTGEQVTIALLAMALKERGLDAVSLTGGMGGIMTDNNHNKARIEKIDASRVRSELDSAKVVIVAGFQGVNELGDITTLGRGGSDTTAVALAAALKADICEIFTDVDGVYTTDPRICKEARRLEAISYDEMLEMAKLGAKVLHPRSVELARKYNIPLAVRTSFNDSPGTMVKEASTMEKAEIRGVALDDEISRVTLTEVPDRPGIAFGLFKKLSEENVAIDMIIQNLDHNSTNDISFTIPSDEVDKAVRVSKAFAVEIGGGIVLVKEHVAKISIIGTGITGNAEAASLLFGTLYEMGVNIEMISTSETRISCLIASEHAREAVSQIHQAFGLHQN